MKFKAKFKKHLPVILTGAAIGAAIAGVVVAVKSKPKYDSLVEETRKEKEANGEELTKKDILKCAFKAYWIPGVIIAAAAACGIGSNYISSKRIAEEVVRGATATAAAKKVHEEYVEAVESKLKPKQVDEIHDEIAKKRTERIFEDIKEGDIDLEGIDDVVDGPVPGRQVLVDCWSGTVFVDDPVKLEKRFNSFNADYIIGNNNFVELSEYYDHMRIPVGKTQSVLFGGWEYDQEKLEFGWTTFPISSGPYKGRIVWAMQFRSGSEPLGINR